MSGPTYGETPQGLRMRLIGEIDFCCPECYWRRRFVAAWQQNGIDFALADFRTHAPIHNPQFLPSLATVVEEIKAWPSKPSPS